MTHPASIAARFTGSLALLVLFLAASDSRVASQTPAAKVDREYTLESSMLGYRGVGGDIEGVRNPVLWARTGETVRIVLINGELMVHDLVVEALGVRTPQILDKGAKAVITFTAKANDTYFCSVPGHRAAGMEGRIEVSDEARVTSDGTAPESNGRTLNLDFEKGTLDDWTATGDAFALIKGEVAPGQTPDKRGGKGSAYYVGSNAGGAIRKGTLTSAPFKVTQPYASFLLSGGAFTSTRVDLLLVPAGEKAERQVIFTMSGANSGTMRPVVVDLKPYVGKDIAIQLVDDETGQTVASYLKESPWAHINFDQFRFHESRPFFPTEITSSEINTLPPMDPIKFNGLSGVEAAKAMTVPKGFTVKLAASEPAVVRPIAFTLDDRGRLWVAEAHTYPTRAAEGQGKDRILIFEDTNGDGTLDSRKIFIENLNLVSGIEVGFGGVWVGAAPYLMFIPVKAGTDVPSGPPQILLDGWGYQDTHEMLNTFTWGPDGWLYGTHGVFTNSNVGKPGAPDSERQKLNGAHLALPPDEARLRSICRRHEQPVGPRLQRLRPRVHDGVRDRAPLSGRAGRALQAAGGQALQSLHLRRHQDRRRSRALGRASGTACGQQPVGVSRRRPRAFRRDDLPRRRHLAGGVPQLDLHEQHPRQPHEHRRAEAVGIGLCRDARTGLPARQRLVEPDAELSLWP